MIKRCCLAGAALLCLGALIPAASAAGVAVELPELNMRFESPEGWIALTRNMREDDPALEALGIDQAELNRSFISNSVYFSALSDDRETELIVAMETSSEIRKAYDLSLQTGDAFTDIEQETVARHERAGETVMRFTKYEHKQAAFIMIDYYREFNRGTAYSRNYSTIINGQAITVSLHSFSGEISGERAAALQRTVDSIEFTEVTEKPSFNYQTIVYGIVGIFIIIGAALIFKIRRNKRPVKRKTGSASSGSALKNKYTRW